MALLALKEVGNVYHHHSSRQSMGLSGNRKSPLFSPEVPDDKWLEYVGSRGWFVFSQDRKFHKTGFENEMYALQHFNVGCFYLWGADAPTADKALAFLKAYDKILKVMRTARRPFIYEITKSGKLVQIDMIRHKVN